MPLTPTSPALYYELHGEHGPAVVLVHGYTGDLTDWRYQVPELSRDHRVLVFDHRGHGRSGAPGDRRAYRVERMVEDTVQLVARVGFERYHLVGHSMGGAVAQEIALAWPERLLSLTLQDTSHWFGDHGEPGGTPPYAPPEDVKASAERVARMSRDALIGGWAGLLAWRGTTDRAGAIRVPTLILHGDRDASRILEGSARLAELIPHAVVEVIEGAGHSPHRERPEAYNRVLRRFLEHSAGAA